MLILFTVTIFLGALLLFLVEPMVGRMLLPLLGGVPAVWNTTLVFYQATLLAGYAYAHFAPKWLGVRRQVVLHAVLLLLPLLVLPIAVPLGWSPPTIHNPIPWLLAVLAVMVGLPFFVVSTMSPLLQRWFSAGTHRHASDPYFLYAASNCGSLLALVSYPVLIEPRLGLIQQSRWWTTSYVVLAVLTIICATWAWRLSSKSAPIEESAANAKRSSSSVEHLTWPRRWRWILLAFVPSSLMLSVTTFVTSEVVPIPLMWVIPLGIYLLTFILVFAKRRLVPHHWIVRVFPFVVIGLVMMLVTKTLSTSTMQVLVWPIAVHFAGLFVVAMVCHGELAEDRPSVIHLTEFYLWISVGGVLGGMFNALLAPAIFPTVIEYPVTLLLACLLVHQKGGSGKVNQRTRILDFVLPMVLGLFTAALFVFLVRPYVPQMPPQVNTLLAYWLPPLVCLTFLRRPLRFALGATILLVAIQTLKPKPPTLLVGRSFFGISRVETIPGAEYLHFFRHGAVQHGMQSLDPKERRIPLLYFTRSGPVGQAVMMLPGELKEHVAVVGLGIGTMACYAEPGQQWTFYEIDPEVDRIASDPRYFTYLEDCQGQAKTVLGDARLSLQKVPDGQFGLIVLDAFSSDTPPVHLLTREALALYLRKLTPKGVLIYNITNGHLDLEPVLANLAQDAGLFSLCRIDSITPQEFVGGKRRSWWLVMTRNEQWISLLAQDPRWRPPQSQAGVGLWTDDYASVFSIFHWK